VRASVVWAKTNISDRWLPLTSTRTYSTSFIHKICCNLARLKISSSIHRPVRLGTSSKRAHTRVQLRRYMYFMGLRVLYVRTEVILVSVRPETRLVVQSTQLNSSATRPAGRSSDLTHMTWHDDGYLQAIMS
jgi:hypothetical protein